MKVGLTIVTAIVVICISGCDVTPGQENLFTVDFQKNQTLRYEFVSSRDIALNWDSSGSSPKPTSKKVDRFSESMEMVVAYTPLEIDPYGLTTIRATCESVKVKRSSSARRRAPKKDAVENLPGKTFSFTIGPSGRIEDYSQLNKLIRQTGEKSFRQDTRRGKIKEPDMTADFIASQWYLWDSISSITKPAEGVAIGQTWQSQLSLPTPMVARKARNVSYTLDEIRQTKKGRLAVIRSSYSAAKSVPKSWPMPYPDGTFRMSGTFGFLSRYKVRGLHGEGEELFNIDKGRIEQYTQQYEAQFDASFPFSFGVNVKINIKQNLTMQLLEQ